MVPQVLSRFFVTAQIEGVSKPLLKKDPAARRGQFREKQKVSLPIVHAFVCETVNQKVDKGADFGLGKPTRRIDGINALHFCR